MTVATIKQMMGPSTGSHAIQTFNMEIDLGKHKYFYITLNTNNDEQRIELCTRPEGKSIRLCAVQTKMLLDGLDIIDNGATIAWEHLDAEAKHEYQYHLGFGVNLTLSLFRNSRFYDIRRWWIPPNQTNAVATRTGITLNTDQAKLIREARDKIIQTVPELEEIGPCECWLENSYINCRRCNPHKY